jgi:branched-chain amino acid transport system ATP-binding protein
VTSPLLNVDGLSKHFGGIRAVDALSLQVMAGEIFGLIGPNGSGKTTLFNLITGIYRPTGGKVTFKEQDVTGWKPHRMVAAGMARTFQNLRLFGQATVYQNVLLGAHRLAGYTLLDALLHTRRWAKVEREIAAHAEHWLEQYGLTAVRHEVASSLPQGMQRKVEIVRALSAHPTLLCLDEPAAGLNPTETQELMDFILGIRSAGHTVFLIEHDMKLVKGICDRIAVLQFGQKLAEGDFATVSGHPAVIEAYLGRRFKRAKSH